MKNLTAVLLTALLVLTISLNLACQKQSAPQSPGTGAGNEVQNAQQTLDKMRATTSFEQFPELLTNRTAAGMSFPLVIFAQKPNRCRRNWKPSSNATAWTKRP